MSKRNAPDTPSASAVAQNSPARGRPVGQVATRGNILRAAIDIFAKNGFAGARVEKISKAARSTDRMIYYYFGSKEGLFVAALETIYKELGDAETALDLSGLNPDESLRAIIRFTWNHYRAHPEMLTLLNNENLHHGKHVSRSKRVKELSFPLVSILSEVLTRGVKEKVFRPDIDANDLYIAMCALGYFYLSNRYTLSAFLGRDLMAPAALANWEEVIETIVLRFVLRDVSRQERQFSSSARAPETPTPQHRPAARAD
jgi:TetR/AcrR family transcriptional regulator, upper aerobic nicotinate degradation pathway regulator